MLNSVTLIGRLVKEPAVFQTEDGKTFARFTLAISKNREIADFVDLIAWGKNAETISKQAKGQVIGIEGTIRSKLLETDGKKKNTLSIVADSIVYIGPKPAPKEE